jgi:SAM-dependent methyltransferase
MSAANLKEQIASARAYEDLFVPALFGQWAPIVADAAQIESGNRILDIACGTGVLAREAARRTGRDGYVAGLDVSPGMLAVAKELAPAVDWKQGVAEMLPFEDECFDATVCQFGLMFFPDRQRAIREMLRVMVPGGRMVVAVWDSLANTPAYAADVALLERIAGTEAANALRVPFVLGDTQMLTNLLVEAGASSVEIRTCPGTARFPDVSVMVQADLRGWLPVMGVILTEEEIHRIILEAEEILAPYITKDGKVEFESPAHVVTALKA